MNQTNKCNCHYGCEPELQKINDTAKKVLTISWQRLVERGNTCPRCGSTEEELGKAVRQLKEKLNSLKIDVILEKTELSLDEFKKDPIESNRILFNGRPLEDVIDAETGQSQCCDICGDEECRTVEVKGGKYETIPAELIVKAGLRVANGL